jgi:hypothetical protein
MRPMASASEKRGRKLVWIGEPKRCSNDGFGKAMKRVQKEWR